MLNCKSRLEFIDQFETLNKRYYLEELLHKRNHGYLEENRRQLKLLERIPIVDTQECSTCFESYKVGTYNKHRKSKLHQKGISFVSNHLK